jgi:hypothetical protein
MNPTSVEPKIRGNWYLTNYYDLNKNSAQECEILGDRLNLYGVSLMTRSDDSCAVAERQYKRLVFTEIGC